MKRQLLAWSLVLGVCLLCGCAGGKSNGGTQPLKPGESGMPKQGLSQPGTDINGTPAQEDVFAPEGTLISDTATATDKNDDALQQGSSAQKVTAAPTADISQTATSTMTEKGPTATPYTGKEIILPLDEF